MLQSKSPFFCDNSADPSTPSSTFLPESRVQGAGSITWARFRAATVRAPGAGVEMGPMGFGQLTVRY